HRPELEGQFLDFAVEGERYLIVLFVNRRAGVDSDVEGLINRHYEWDRARHPLRGEDLPIDFQHANAPLADAGAVILELEYDRMFTWGECLRAFPAKLLKR